MGLPHIVRWPSSPVRLGPPSNNESSPRLLTVRVAQKASDAAVFEHSYDRMLCCASISA